MKFGRLGAALKHGYNAMTMRESDMLMDIGYQLMEAKVSLEMSDVFAWSIVIIALSQCWEILVILLIKGLCRKGCV